MYHEQQQNRRRWLCPGFILILGVLALGRAESGAAQTRLVLVGATLIDGTGTEPVRDARIAIVNELITCVSGPPGCPTDDTYVELDVRGLWITPGLIDSHVHLDFEIAPAQATRQQALRFALGITTVRDAGTLQLEAVFEARARGRDSAYPYPRIVVSERPGSPYDEAYGREPGPELVEHFAAIGVDAIKVKGPFTDGQWQEEIRTARRLGLPAYGHTWRGPPLEALTSEAIAAGLSGVSHLTAIPLAAQPDSVDVRVGAPSEEAAFWAWHKAMWTTSEQGKLDRIIDEIVGAGVWLEPMLVTEYFWGVPLNPPHSLSFLRDTPPSPRDLLTGRDVLAEPVATPFPEAYARMAGFVRLFRERGGVVIAGGDDRRPGLDLHEEIALLVDAGLSPGHALRAATHDAAMALDRDDIGTVTPGKLADLVVYDADPLGARGNTLHVRHVIKGGHVYASSDLLQPFRDSYAETQRSLWGSRALRGARALGSLLVVGLAMLLIGRSVLAKRGRVRNDRGSDDSL